MERPVPVSRRNRAQSPFPDTNWGMVNRAAQREQTELARDALAQLCASYREPVLAFVRAQLLGAQGSRAEDLTQQFFCQLLDGGLQSVDAERGRFRNWLLGALKNFLFSDRRYQTRRRRDQRLVTGYEDAPDLAGDDSADPERLYLRSWARTLTLRTTEIERAKFEARGETDLFDALLPLLEGADRGAAGEAASAAFGLTSSAFQQRLSRLRRSFGDTMRAEVARTCVSQESECIENELIELLDGL